MDFSSIEMPHACVCDGPRSSSAYIVYTLYFHKVGTITFF